MEDNNVFEGSTGPLGANATWVSEWQDMRGFQAVSSTLNGDEIISEARFEWSDDRTTLRAVQVWVTDLNPISTGGSFTAAAPTQAKYVRVVVENGGNAQGPDWKVLVTLLQQAPMGFIAPLCSFPRDDDPGQTTRAIMYARRLGSVDPQYTQVLAGDGGELVVTDGPLPTTTFEQSIPQDTVSTLVTSFNPEARNSLSIFNNSDANLYVRLNADVSIVDGEWGYKVLPGWMWVAPKWGGDVYIAWDAAGSGTAQTVEVTG